MTDRLWDDNDEFIIVNSPIGSTSKTPAIDALIANS